LKTNIDGLGDSAQMDAVDGKVKIDYADLARDDPDGESDDDDLVQIKRGGLVSCSTTNSLVDERMMDIVKTAKEARAMIRKLSFNPPEPEDGDGGVKFEMGWDEESEDCDNSFVKTYGVDFFPPRERKYSLLSFSQSECDFQYFDYDWDDDIGWWNTKT
jgi:hypothetical protein